MVVENILPFILSPNGWLLAFASIALYFLYQRFITPLQKEAEYHEEEKLRKKYDDDWNRGKLKNVRERQQQHHDKVSELLKAEEDEKKKRKQEELLKELSKTQSVGRAAIQQMEIRELLASHSKKPVKKETIEEIIDNAITRKPVVVFSKSWCPFCRKLKSMLATYRLSDKHFDYIELDEGDEKFADAIQTVFEKRYGSRTVPKLFIGGNFVGGCDDAVRLNQDGTLEALITSVIGK